MGDPPPLDLLRHPTDSLTGAPRTAPQTQTAPLLVRPNRSPHHCWHGGRGTHQDILKSQKLFRWKIRSVRHCTMALAMKVRKLRFAKKFQKENRIVRPFFIQLCSNFSWMVQNYTIFVPNVETAKLQFLDPFFAEKMCVKGCRTLSHNSWTPGLILNSKNSTKASWQGLPP